MDRIISVEDRIKRAEEIYQKRMGRGNNIVSSNSNLAEGNKIYKCKIFKRMLIQLIICSITYLGIHAVKNNNYVFSQDFSNSANWILSYTIDFNKIIENFKQKFEPQKPNEQNAKIEEIEKIEEKQENKENKENKEIGVGGAEVPIVAITEEEQKLIDIKKITTFIQPVQAKITSPYGLRDSRGGLIPVNHTGIDYGVITGTDILSSTKGKVLQVSAEGDYGVHVKIQVEKICVIYAHCSQIVVNEGEMVQQGQKIAISGNTGNSTGPHLHFEIRYNNEPVDPKILLEV